MSSALNKYFIKGRNNKNTIITAREKQENGAGRASILTLKSLTAKSDAKSRSKTVMKYFESRSRMNTLATNSTRLSEKITIKEEKALNQIYNHKLPNNKKRYELHPQKRLEPIRLVNRPSSSKSNASYLSLSSSRTKLTDQYFRQVDNIRMVERLLLVKPTKEVCKKEHSSFYESHIKYRNHMQVSKYESNRKHMSNPKNKHK